MPLARVGMIIPSQGEALKVAGGFRELTGLKGGLGCRFKRFPVLPRLLLLAGMPRARASARRR